MFGLVTKGRLKREVAAAAAAYRWERDEALAEGERLRREYLDRLAELVRVDLVRPDGFSYWQWRIVIEADELFTRAHPSQSDYERLTQRILLGLQSFRADRRPDMRVAMPQGIGGPELPSTIGL